MRRSGQILCAVLFVGTTFCSLWLSASSTLHKAELVGVPTGAIWSAVGVLELVSLAGTVRWLVARTRRGRVHAVVVVGAVATVTSFAGWAAYGWFGLVAPLGVIATIHMIYETLDDLSSTDRRWGSAAEVNDVDPPSIPVQASRPAPAPQPGIDAPTPLHLAPPPPALDAELDTPPYGLDIAADLAPLLVPGTRRTSRQARDVAKAIGLARRPDWDVATFNEEIDKHLDAHGPRRAAS